MSIRPHHCLWPVLVLGLALLAGQSPGNAADKDDKTAKADFKAKIKAKLAEKAKAKDKAKAEEKEAKPPEPRPDPKPLDEAGKAQAAKIAAMIDKAIGEKLAAAKVPASPRATDAEFLRRVYLDVTGTVPTPEKTKAFLDSTDPDKRTKLVDELVGGKNFGRHMTDVWMNLLVQRNSDNRRLDFSPFESWLEDKFNIDLPWDKLVTDMMTATGTQEDSPATTYFLAGQTVDKWTDSTCKVLLGVQLQCAQCHNHPFTDWKQTEYWGMAGFYMKVRLNGARQGAAAAGATPTVLENAAAGRGPQQKLPESAKIVPPKFLGGPSPTVPAGDSPRAVLAKWLTAPENPYFAKAMVNRTWAQLFGRGFVNPIDDMHDGNKPSHPELLAALAKEFAHGYDVKALVRGICTSETYQRSSVPVMGNEKDNQLFSHMAVKVLSPYQMFDSLAVVVGTPQGGPPRQRPAMGMGPNAGGPRQQFVNFFTVQEDGADPTNYEGGIPQALRLMNRPNITRPGGLLSGIGRGTEPAKAVEQIYVAALSRRPTAAETAKLSAYVAKAPDALTGYGDIVWAVLNSSEFTLNH